MLRLLGLAELSSLELWTLVLAGIVFTLLTGWILDMVMNKLTFGVFTNAFICMAGILLGLYGFREIVGSVSVSNMPKVIGFITASVIGLIMMCMFLRRALKL